jgi:hypothetical protein
MATARVITLLGEPIQNEDSKAAEAITPGHLVTFDGNGDLIKNTTTGARVQTAFALEREESGYGIDDDYAVDDTVKVGIFAPGMRVNAIVASGVNVAQGALMTGGAAGTVAGGGTATTAIGRAARAINNAAGPGTARVSLEIM